MEIRNLNFPTAMKLAAILKKYIDPTSIDGNETVLDFIDNLLSKIEPLDYLKLVQLFTGETSENVSKYSGEQLVEIVASGMENNKIISMLSTYKEIGF